MNRRYLYRGYKRPNLGCAVEYVQGLLLLTLGISDKPRDPVSWHQAINSGCGVEHNRGNAISVSRHRRASAWRRSPLKMALSDEVIVDFFFMEALRSKAFRLTLDHDITLGINERHKSKI